MPSEKKNRIKMAGYDKSKEFEDEIAINKNGKVDMLNERPELIGHIDDWLESRIKHKSMSNSKRVCDILAKLYPDLWTPTKVALEKWLESYRQEAWDKVKRMKSV